MGAQGSESGSGPPAARPFTHRERSLAGYSPWGHKESDTAERLTHTLATPGQTRALPGDAWDRPDGMKVLPALPALGVKGSPGGPVCYPCTSSHLLLKPTLSDEQALSPMGSLCSPPRRDSGPRRCCCAHWGFWAWAPSASAWRKDGGHRTRAAACRQAGWQSTGAWAVVSAACPEDETAGLEDSKPLRGREASLKKKCEGEPATTWGHQGNGDPCGQEVLHVGDGAP